MQSGRRAILVCLLAAAFGLAIARTSLSAKEVEIVPRWTVIVLDEAGVPLPGFEVNTGWEFYGAFGEHRGNETKMTDAQGRVIFPARTFQATSAGLSTARALSSLNVHASFGPSGSVTIRPRGYKVEQASYGTEDKIYDDPGAKTAREQGGFVTIFRLLQLDFFDFLSEPDLAVAKRMLTADPTIAKLRNRHGETPLIHLSMFDVSGPSAEMIEQLLRAGAEINAQAEDGTTALHNAAKNYNVTYMDLLLSKGADPKLKIHDAFYYTTNGFTPLHFLLGAHGVGLSNASAAQKINGIELLLAHGADINASDSTGASPLYLAAVWGDPEIVAALLARGADPDAKNHAGQTPLASITRLDDTPSVHQVRDLLAKASAAKSGNPAKK